VNGTPGDDNLFGSWRDDVILGRGGWDIIRGRDGDDILDGGAGNDWIFGQAGHDSIWGGRGLDRLAGGTGRDDFWFDTRHSYDIIRDFRANDAIVIDIADGAFEGVTRRDLEIRHRVDFDRIYVDGDLVAEVYGVSVRLADIDLFA
jgi:anthrax edema toxin adenylate cyclase